MAFDGITVAAIADELDRTLTGGRISKIIQPEQDELLLTIKNNSKSYRLILSASASLPLAYLTAHNKTAPMNAPNFCMLLRKHAGGGKILSISQPGLERILQFDIEHRNEMGDLCTRRLVIEIMGKYSNIIFMEEDGTILDAIKHVSFNVSSVREVLPGRKYFIPNTQKKSDPLTAQEEDFYRDVCSRPMTVAKALSSSYTGISYPCAEEICFRASIDGDRPTDALTETARLHLYHTFRRMMEDVQNRDFHPVIYYKGNEPKEYGALPLTCYGQYRAVPFASISALLETYYEGKEKVTRIRQKSTDLRRIVNTVLERTAKKLNLQEKQLHDTEKRDKYRIYGELLNTYGYSLEKGAKEMEAVNYYNNEPVRVPLDPLLSPSENAKKYFTRYNKLKRTAEDLTGRIEQTEADLEHLESIRTSLDIAENEEDLTQIRDELAEYGYIKKKSGSKKGKKAPASAPLHFLSSDGFDIYVGKNNFQNEELSFHFASGDDWWFHAKKMPGSHVIVKSRGIKDLPDRVFEEAGSLAAYYSSGRSAPKVEIDYTLKKNLRKPNGSRPGFVVYYTNYSLMAAPDIHGLRQLPS